MRTLVFIPAWNEEASIAAVIGDVREHLPDADLLVVDDGSTDATAERAREAGRWSPRCPSTRASGRRCRPATYTPCARATSSARTSTPTGSTRPPRSPACSSEVLADRADLVIGSRYQGARRRGTSRRRRRLQADDLAADRDQRLPLLPHPRDAAALHRHDQRHAGREPAGDVALQRELLAGLRRDRVAAAGRAPGAAGRGGAGADARAGRRQLLPDPAALGLLHLQGPDRPAGRDVPAAAASRSSGERRPRPLRDDPKVNLTAQTRILARRSWRSPSW